MHNTIIVRTGDAPVIHFVTANEPHSVHCMLDATPDLRTNHILERTIVDNGEDFVIHTDNGRTFYGKVERAGAHPYRVTLMDENRHVIGSVSTIWMAMHLTFII